MKKILIILILSLVLISGCEQQGIKPESTSSEDSSVKETVKDYGFTQKITYKDENSTVTITKNKLTKKATVDIEFEFLESDLELFGESMIEFSTTMMCGLSAMGFFDPEGLEEWNKEMQSQDFIVKDDSPEPETKEDLRDNLLEGYTITNVDIVIKDKETKKKLSDCHITGKEESDIKINYY